MRIVVEYKEGAWFMSTQKELRMVIEHGICEPLGILVH